MTFQRRTPVFVLAALAGLTTLPGAAQIKWDSTGDNLLSGAFNFREVIWQSASSGSNTLDRAVTQFGTITFDGSGNYQIQASAWDSDTNSLNNFSLSGTYTIAASGFGFITRADRYGGIIYGGISHGVFIGSSTESQLNNLFVAAQANASAPTTSSFTSTYSVAYMNFPTLNLDQARDASYRLTPNGSGGLAAVNLTGFIGGSYAAVNQTINNATYSFSAGLGTLHFGGTLTAQNLLAGDQALYVSPDGEFIFGGSTNGWDMLVGVRRGSNIPSSGLDGLFYTAAVDLDRFPSVPELDSYFGSFKADSGDLIGHQRLLVAPDTAAYDYTFSDFYSLDGNGVHDDFLGYSLILGSSQNFRVGYGAGDYLGVTAGVRAPSVSGTSPYINPMGVLNGASFTPFTTGLAPGTLVTIFGSGFADGSDSFVDASFPTTLGNVQVMVNGRLAPIYVVTATQISIVLPYDTEAPVGEITVIRNGTTGNRVTFFVNATSPGIFTVPPRGIGYAAALHPDYSLIDATKPAQVGETIQVFLTGLGEVNPAVAAGTPGPTDPLSTVTSPVGVMIDQLDANIGYAGLAPLLPGLYQLNILVPAGTRAQDVYVDVSGPDAYNSQVLLPVGGGAAADARAAGKVGERRRRSARGRPTGRGARGGPVR